MQFCSVGYGLLLCVSTEDAANTHTLNCLTEPFVSLVLRFSLCIDAIVKWPKIMKYIFFLSPVLLFIQQENYDVSFEI